MRASIDPQDHGFVPVEQQQHIRVLLDGEIVKNVITADEELGVVIRPRRDAAGKVMHDGHRFLQEALHGSVTIKLGGAK